MLENRKGIFAPWTKSCPMVWWGTRIFVFVHSLATCFV